MVALYCTRGRRAASAGARGGVGGDGALEGELGHECAVDVRLVEAEGFADARTRVVMPIGLPLGGRTPAEIAVSIGAQLIEDRAAHAAR